MRSILVSEPVWEAIAARGKFGETEDDVLRREFKIPPNPRPSTTQVPVESTPSGTLRTGSPRRHIATRRMSAYVGDNQLRVSFQDGPAKSWKLPPREDKAAIRAVRDAAVGFALAQGASVGQKFAVMKALTDAGFHLTK